MFIVAVKQLINLMKNVVVFVNMLRSYNMICKSKINNCDLTQQYEQHNDLIKRIEQLTQKSKQLIK